MITPAPVVRSGNLASGQVGGPHVASGSITSGRLGVTGTPDGSKVLRDDFSWVTPGAASITSGSVGPTAAASGTGARYVGPLTSGLTVAAVTTEETISGVRAVCVSQSGNVRIAMASVSGRMPAVGVVFDNVLSGLQCNVYTDGAFLVGSGLIDSSGYLGQPHYVGRSGQVVTTSGSFNSGGLLSGDVLQAVGTMVQRASGACSGLFLLGAKADLPFVVSLVYSGNVASGQIGGAHVAAAGLTSGNYASGSVGYPHLANASVQSGTVASGALTTYHVASGTAVQVAQTVAPVWSGTYNTLITSEPISGVKAVQMDKAGSGTTVRMAMAAVSGRWPAIGVVYDNVASGIQCNVYMFGALPLPSGILASGLLHGKRLWVGRSGDIVTLSGGYNSGGFLSGDVTQCMGTVQATTSGRTSGVLLINTDHAMYMALSGLGVGGVTPFFAFAF